MRNKLVWLAVVVIVVVVAIVWKLRHGGDRAVEDQASGRMAAGATGGGRDDSTSANSTPASVGGRVTRKADGAGIAGAVVSLARAELSAGMFETPDAPTIVITTDAKGAWTAPSVGPGMYTLGVTATGFLPATRDKLRVTAAERKTGIDFALDAGGTIVSGTISDVGGGPIAGARITIERSGLIELKRHAELIAIAGADGSYQIALASGSFEAVASHDDYTQAARTFELADKPLTIDFVLTPGGVIRGQIVTREGKPLPGAMIESRGGTSRVRSDKRTWLADATGNFVLKSLGSGAISISAAGRGFASASPTVVELGIGEEVDGIRVVVDRAFSISGRVVRKGRPAEGIAGVVLGLFSMGSGAELSAPEPTGADGKFEIVGVRAASYMLAAVGEGMMPEIGQPIEVVDKDLKDVIIEMATGVTISGRVAPPAIAAIGISPETVGIGNVFEALKAGVVSAESEASGSFVLHNVPSGSFTMTATTTDGRGGKRALVVAETDQRDLVITLEKRGSLGGRVIDDKGAPVVGVRVKASPHARDIARMMTEGLRGGGDGVPTGADGSFRLVGLPDGKVDVTVEDDQGQLAWSDPALARAGLVPITFELQDAGTATGITLTIESRNGAIRGQVLGADRKPAADAWVTATAEATAAPSSKEAVEAELRRQPYTPVLTNAEGRFTIDKLRRGSYELVADGPKGSARVQQTGVKSGDTVTLVLAPLGTLSGHVTIGAAPVGTYDLTCTIAPGHVASGDDRAIRRRISAADGAFVLEHLAPGAYTCDALADAGTATGKVDVPAGDAKLELVLARWASVSGTVISVLSGDPVVGLKVMGRNVDQRSMGDILSGKGPTTDASGRFIIPRVEAGTGTLFIIPAASSLERLASRDYTVTAGQQLDLGTIKVIPPRTGDAGTFGFSISIAGEALTVETVKSGGPAETAGIKVGDKITTIDGRTIPQLTPRVAQALLSSGTVGIGATVRIGVDRAGTPAQFTVVAIKW